MSMINRLVVEGVRSFGEEKQRIEFHTPLTLIVGENGCGKTTIIECLKYAITGDVPPGSDRGRNFVHDVKLLNKNVSNARVQLTITDPNGIDKTVTRTMRLENLKGRTKFSTDDSTITFSSRQGGNQSGRINDVNSHMCESMGVSKAILNNVVFCHQEDSNWPLDEGKKLKEKFDAIFGTTEYNNAINKILKIKKSYDDDLKMAKGDIKFYAEVKGQVERKERELADLHKKSENIKKQCDTYEEQLAPLEIKKEQIMKKEMDYGKLASEKHSYISIIANKTEERQSLERKIKKRLHGTIEELEEQKTNFLENQREKKNQLKNIESENEKLIKSEREKQKTINDLQNKVDNSIDKIRKLQDLKSERFDKVKDVCSILKLDFNYDHDQSINTQGIRDTVENVKAHIVKKENNIQSLKTNAIEDDQNYQKKIDKLRDEKTKIETNLSSQRQSLKDFDVNSQKINKELKDSEESIPMLNKLKPQIDEYEKRLKKLNDENNVDDLRDRQDAENIEIIELEDTLAQLEEEIDILQSASRITGELDLKQNDLNKDQKEFDRIKNKLSSNFKNLFPNQNLETNFRQKVQSKREDLDREVKNIKERLPVLQRECDRLQDQRVSLRTQQKVKDQEIQKIEQNVADLCLGQDYMDYLTSQKEKVEKLNLELAVKESSKNTYKDFIEKINDIPCCPLCHKDLDDDDADKLKVELEENIDELPKKIATISKKLKDESAIYDKLNGFKSSYDSLDKIRKEKTKIESDLKNLDVKLSKSNEEKENLETIVAEPESLLNLISPSFFADVCKLDDLQRTINNKTKEVNALKAKVPSNVPKKSLSQAQAERKETADKIKAKNDLIKKMNEEINIFQTELMDTREALNNLNKKKNDIQERVQGIEILKDQLKQIKEDKKNLESRIKENESKLEPTIDKFNSLIKEKQKARENHQKKIDFEQELLHTLKVDQSEIERLEKEIEGYEAMDLENSLNKLRREIEKVKAAEKLLQEQIAKKADEIQELKDFLANEETTHRNITDNIDLLKLEEKKKEAEVKLEELNAQIGELDLEKMKIERRQVLTKIQDITSSRTKMCGQQDELAVRINSVENELNTEKYKTAKKNYMNAISREEVLSSASSDLKKYTTALEKSLLKYHQEKMDQINQIMKELWNSIYQGNDIDYIMIKTDEEDGSTAASEKSRRSYNYRVVQVKNGIEIDMRGRCSAGQKVLASLIIRIALADTFSSSCGILALDEPTTNLDQNNVASLSEALAQLVSERDNGRFMLIVITHDENFVRSLERAEKYWKVSRDYSGNSVIQEFSNY